MRFEPYDYIGTILPGSAVLFAAMLLFPEVKAQFGKDGIEIAGLGLFVVVAFVLGHIVQALGNLIELATHRAVITHAAERLLKKRQTVIAPEQRARLAAMLKAELGADLDGMDAAAWRAVRRQMYAGLTGPGVRDRIDTFNRLYGMLRGMTAALLMIAGLVGYMRPDLWALCLVIVAAAAATWVRMLRFSETYIRELVVAYLVAGGKGEAGGA